MGTEILKSFGTLQFELEQAKSSLKGVDENIKRLIGRDPSEFPARTSTKRGLQNSDGRARNPKNNRGGGTTTGGESGVGDIAMDDGEIANKRRPTGVSVFKRLSDKYVTPDEEPLQTPQKQIISKVIVTPKELPSRQDALAAQCKDEQSKARNRRMFGALLGTLQKFQQEETRLKQKEEKRAQLEKKIEEHEIKEKEEIKKERQELFFNRKRKQAEIKMIELKMMRMKEYAAWEERQKPRANFIQTKSKPVIHYLPRKLNDKNKELLDSCRIDIEKIIEKKRQQVFTELQHIEERMKKNFENRKTKDEKENEENVADGHKEEDDNGEVKAELEEVSESKSVEMETETPKMTEEKMEEDTVNENDGKTEEQTTTEVAETTIVPEGDSEENAV